MSNDDIMSWFDSENLGAWDLQDRDVTVTIERVVLGNITGEGGKKEKKPLIYFKGKKKPLAACKTNIRTIKAIYGTSKAADLPGKRITLFPTTTKGRGGGIVDCIRIRPAKPKGPDDSFPDVPVDQEMRERQMREAGTLPASDDVAPSDNPDEGP